MRHFKILNEKDDSSNDRYQCRDKARCFLNGVVLLTIYKVNQKVMPFSLVQK